MSTASEKKEEAILETKWNREFESISKDLSPSLHHWDQHPVRIVEFQPDATAYFGVTPRTSSKYALADLPVLNWTKDDEFVLDFGLHLVGALSFQLDFTGANMDAPCRLHLTFGESLFDVTMDMDNVKTWISTAWLPDEVLNVDMCPATVALPRRYSFRYLRIRVVDVSPKFTVRFSAIKCTGVSAVAPAHQLDDFRFQDPILEAIDHVGISTLRDCMQTVFEDGPRRDRRLWIGDLRLQALTNYATFADYALVKRCLYMFAAVARVDGSLPACVFERPSLSPSTDYIVDYDALFASIVHDYVAASGDLKTGHALWDTLEGCLRRAIAHLDPATHVFDGTRGKGWKFLDWAPTLDRTAGSHGLLLFCLKAVNSLALLLDKPQPYLDLVAKMTAAAPHFLSADQSLFVSGPDGQVSYASAAWLVLADVLPVETARKALLNNLAHPDAAKPMNPYLWHYVCEALAAVGCHEESVTLIQEHWGGMVRAGADTFWECFDKDGARMSPYGDVRNNSFCHAWSCTPSYLLRGALRGYVGGECVGKVSMAELDSRWVKRSTTPI